MDVYDAVASRRAVRRFRPDPLSPDVMTRVLAAAARAPSGSNLQPWRTYVIAGPALRRLKNRVSARLAAGDPVDEPEFEMYPPDLKSPYRERRAAAAEQRYSALGIARDDLVGRRLQVVANWDCFGASTALFCFIDRTMGSAQWADLGMYLQTVMLLVRAEGLHSCPQLAWTVYRRTVTEVLSPPDDLLLFCGMSVGYEADGTPRVRIDRAPLADTVTFVA
jgi:nitroreductase